MVVRERWLATRHRTRVLPANRIFMHCSLSSRVLASTTISSWAGASTEGIAVGTDGSNRDHKENTLGPRLLFLTAFASFDKARNLRLERMHERSALIFCASLASPLAQPTRKAQCQRVPPLFRASRRVHGPDTGPACSFSTLSSFSFAPDSPLGFFDPSFSSRDAEAIFQDLRKKAYALGPTPIPPIDYQRPPSSESNHFICYYCKFSLSWQNCPPNRH